MSNINKVYEYLSNKKNVLRSKLLPFRYYSAYKTLIREGIGTSNLNGIISNASSIRINGGGTYISLPIRYLLHNKIFVDRIVILADNEINCRYGRACQSYVDEYRLRINPEVWVHAIDLQGYGTQQFSASKVNMIAGWSEKVLDFISEVEKGA